MSKLLNVSSSPHVRSHETTHSIMLDVAIAMLPATAFGVYHFGMHALLVLIVTVAACVLSEYIYEKLMKKPSTISDCSALVTGMILALNMPPEIPVWIPALGGIFAIIVVKQLYGGLGQNFMNPALAARCFLLISFAGKMTNFSYSGFDGVSGATPLAVLKSGGTVDVPAMFVGNIPGTIGEVSVIALLIGAAYLLAKKVISIRIPGTYILTVVVFAILFGGHGFDLNYIAAHLCGGGLIFGAFFMATDYVTSPITPKGQIVFGILLGVLTGLFRIFGGSAEGVSYAIIISNILVPLIEKVTLPKAFGKEGK
ncbi:RnfABCDGE type electron transport complex subunit D [Enterocloster sp.]|jgi:Na+-translocating ferredoxin:NAD+ oxidoreductase subunit D|uniref:RnfABCDGE type electron transport complex subunit D n=1 Tax=Enterocloster sp. TaxID=2719315 RepID=UPI00257CF22D|nr:RnfABCDGE type electron transport complex subunit D [Enterocloster sp.]MBS5406174.1 RnfABCDGE type electron transport complex subunit D [Enterocloster sp.]